jgi:pyridoxine kinase
MPFALILSSHVAASRVGGMAQVLALQPFKIDAALVPTVLFGRHPGWGPPGGAAVAAETMAAMLEGIEAQGLFALTDTVITGYFASADQVAAASEAIARVRAANPQTLVLVDPVIGEEGKGIYVKPEVAAAVRDQLVPLADVIAPNRFELAWLSGGELAERWEDAEAQAAMLGKPTLVSSLVEPGDPDALGVLYTDDEEASYDVHPRLADAPKGTGDVLTALFAAWRIRGLPPKDAASAATEGVLALVQAAAEWDAPELPIVAAAERMKAAGEPFAGDLFKTL